jgi:hypothetical protein
VNARGDSGRPRTQVRLGIGLALMIIVCMVDRGYAAYPAGTTNAVLSFIDAAGSHVSVNRHWPWSPEDVPMYPFTPYLWNSCLPGDGAVILLVTGPGYRPPIGTSAEDYTKQYLASLGRAIAASLSGVPRARGGSDLRKIIAGMTTPGDPVYETLKEGILWVNSLDYYESYGYAVFLVIRWKWVFPSPGCYTDMVTVPEGYGIPYVALGRPGKDDPKPRAGVDRAPFGRELALMGQP